MATLEPPAVEAQSSALYPRRPYETELLMAARSHQDIQVALLVISVIPIAPGPAMTFYRRVSISLPTCLGKMGRILARLSANALGSTP